MKWCRQHAHDVPCPKCKPTGTRVVWRESTRDHHVGELDDYPVLEVVRPRKLRHDGTNHNWQVVVLGDRYTWDKIFDQHDPRDLDSTKRAAEMRLVWAIGVLYRAVKGLTRKRAA